MIILQIIGYFILIVLLQVFSTRAVRDIHDFKYYMLSCITFICLYYLIDSIEGSNTLLLISLAVFVVLINVIKEKRG